MSKLKLHNCYTCFSKTKILRKKVTMGEIYSDNFLMFNPLDAIDGVNKKQLEELKKQIGGTAVKIKCTECINISLWYSEDKENNMIRYWNSRYTRAKRIRELEIKAKLWDIQVATCGK